MAQMGQSKSVIGEFMKKTRKVSLSFFYTYTLDLNPRPELPLQDLPFTHINSNLPFSFLKFT